MNQYLLSVYEVGDKGEATPPTPEDMRAFMGRVIALEEGRLVRDEAAAGYHEDESTKEFAARVRAEMGVGDEPPGFEH